MPIHKKLMATEIHSHFVAKHSDRWIEDKCFNSYNQLSKNYCNKAVSELFVGWRREILSELINKYYDVAKGIDLKIGQYYSWAQICFAPVKYEDLLKWYFSINKLGLVYDSTFEGEKKTDSESKQKVDEVKRVEGDYIRFNGESAVERCFYDSAKTQVVIDGKLLKNKFVMVFPYDKPLPDLDQKLLIYKRCICNTVYQYRKYKGGDSEYQKISDELAAQRDVKIKNRRIIIKNVSSVLKHIISLLFLKMERSGDSVDKAKKAMVSDVSVEIQNSAFEYSYKTIETVRKNRQKEMLRVVDILQKQQ